MTLILTLGNSEQLIQLSDRRLSSNAWVVEEESSKAGSLTCVNARLAYGFCGLASRGRFITRDWLLDSLYECGPPDFTAAGILDRLKDHASDAFAKIPWLRTASRSDKRLSVMFSGYVYHHNPSLAVIAIITNYQDFQSGLDSAEAWDEFSLTSWHERRPLDSEPTLFQYAGNWPVITDDDEHALRVLLEAKKPPRAIIGKAVELMREMADRPAARGNIGKQLTSVLVPRDWNKPIQSGYHTSVNANVIYSADAALLFSDSFKLLMKDGTLSNPARPIAVPAVSRNQPCPCGSGKKFRNCHGRWPS
jgi:hypothetical protein